MTYPPAPPPETGAPQTVGESPSPRATPRTLLVWAITAINVAVFLAMELSGGSTNTRVLVQFGAKVNQLIAQGEYWRLVAPIFLHIGLMHLVFNSIGLLSFGRLAESVYGHARFLAIYLIAGVAGTTFSYLFSRGVSAGASGAIFGLAGALAVFFTVNRNRGPVAVQGQLTTWVALLVLMTLPGLPIPAINSVLPFARSGIDIWAHAGGLLGGAALAAWLTPRYEPVTTPEGFRLGWRLQRSGPAAWLVVLVVPLVLAVALLRIPGR